MLKTPPLSLYLHLPWCVKKCPYCDFNSWADRDPPKRRYVDALLSELSREAGEASGRPLESVFLGGGTPSLFAPEEIGRILEAVRNLFDAAADIEITMEANPGAVEHGAMAGYREAGVNRLSIGAQSFDDGQLAVLGRVHRSGEIRRAFAEAREAGFDNINLDLMHGLPGQSADAAIADLEAALALGPEHLSWYQLTLEPNTVFHARPPAALPDDEQAWEMQRRGQARLAALGYEQYEVSAWARPGRACRHNLNYWRFGDYLAAGAGAHGKLTRGGRIERYARPAHPRAWMEAVESAAGLPPPKAVTAEDLVFEFMLNASRLTRGFPEALFVERTGLPAETLAERLEPEVRRGLIALDADRNWRPTELGRRFLNDLQAACLPD